MKTWLIAIAMLLAAPTARAQDAPIEEAPPVEPAPEDTSAPVVEEPPPEDPELQIPRIMVITLGDVQYATTQALQGALSDVGEIATEIDYVRAARAAGLPPESDEAIAAHLAPMDVTIAVFARVVRMRGERRARLRLTYRDARSGWILLEEEHPLAGAGLEARIGERIASEARLTIAVIQLARRAAPATQGPEAVPLPPVEITYGAPEERRAPGTAVRVGVTAGFGLGARRFDLPSRIGITRLATSPFPIAGVSLRVMVEPVARGRFSLGGAIDYVTSLGLRSTDTRVDGGTQETSSRSQRIAAHAVFAYRFSDDPVGVAIEAGLGFGVRAFSSEAPVTLPDYFLGGPNLALRARVPFGDSFSLTLGPDVGAIVVMSGELEDRDVDAPAAVLGFDVAASLSLSDVVSLVGSYRESHALLSAKTGDAGDVERYGLLSLLYSP